MLRKLVYTPTKDEPIFFSKLPSNISFYCKITFVSLTFFFVFSQVFKFFIYFCVNSISNTFTFSIKRSLKIKK